ncbi:MAG: hypothetical protein WC527_01675 [Candidatus Margulisiibacteriota bacterium]
MPNPINLCTKTRLSGGLDRKYLPNWQRYCGLSAQQQPLIRRYVQLNRRLGESVKNLLVENGILELSSGSRRLNINLLEECAKSKSLRIKLQIGGLETREEKYSTLEIMDAICGRLMIANEDNFFGLMLLGRIDPMRAVLAFESGTRGKFSPSLYPTLAMMMGQLYTIYSDGPVLIDEAFVKAFLQERLKDLGHSWPLIKVAGEIADLFIVCFLEFCGAKLVPDAVACRIIKMISYCYRLDREK